jgi:hypothetical protein
MSVVNAYEMVMRNCNPDHFKVVCLYLGGSCLSVRSLRFITHLFGYLLY